MGAKILETARLELREIDAGDAAFILELVNDPDWIRFIGDRGVRSLDDARGYIERGPASMYRKLGFGLWLVARKEGDVPIGMCGLIKRDTLEHVDLGYAFLPAYRGQGYARESAEAARDYAFEVLGLDRLVAITDPANDPSGKLLERLGFAFEDTIPYGTQGEVSRLYGLNTA
ncbi:MAG TPA: GNAT family N-acetyltransferase [Usitatibacter sp.]|nr:GNAT family N-acetyltransferase [Usitatibacter sp.]